MSLPELTVGAVKVMHDGNKQSPLAEHPIVQIINIKAIAVADGSVRHRIVVSDGEHYCAAMIGTQHTKLIDEGKLKSKSIVRFTEYVCNELHNKRILVVMNLEVLQTDVAERIGNPTNYEAIYKAQAAASSNNTAITSSTKPNTRPATNSSSNPFSSGANMQLEANITPIKNLNPYQSRWHIKARVSQKSDIKTWRNAKGDGKLFSVNLLDNTGEIKATGFNDQCDRLYNMLEEGKVYYISKARVTMARKQFSTLNNEYELQFENATEIEACSDAGSIPQIGFNFVKIADVDNHQKGENIDVVGVVVETGELNEIVSKSTGKPTKKRDIMIADDSLKRIKLTLWDKKAEEFTAEGSPVLAVKGVRVSDFGGRSLSLGSAGLMKINPDIPEAEALSRWYSQKDPNTQITGYSSAAIADGAGEGSVRTKTKITIQDAKTKGLGANGNPDYFSFRGTIVYFKTETFAYAGCPSCRKKVVLEADGWRCEKCQKNYQAPEYRYILTMSVNDGTGQLYINAFDEVSGAILNMSANDMMKLAEADQNAVQGAFNKNLWRTYNFSVRAKQEVFNDMARIKYSAFEITPINFEREAAEMVARIEKYF